MEFDCPVCHTQLAVQGNSAHCERCAKEYVVEARCPACHKPLEVLNRYRRRRKYHQNNRCG